MPVGLMRRLSTILRSKSSRALDRAEDPRETLDYSYERQLELLQKVRRGVADVATSRKRVELQSHRLEAGATKLEQQAREALASGREDLAREALTRRAALDSELQALDAQRRQLEAEEAKLVDASRRLESKVEAFRTRKETIKATYTAAEAQTKIGEAVAGISEEMGDVGLAMHRAEDKVAQMQARAGAVDELMASGALEDLTQPTDRLEAELGRAASESQVELQLARLKGEIEGAERRPLEAGNEEEKR
jgi:phage shock protein A